jgi:AraC family transcriptional activator FtrA
MPTSWPRAIPRVTVEPDRIYILHRRVATSAGSAAATDLGLHLLRETHGADVANRVARELVMPAHRSGGQAHYTPLPVAAPHDSRPLAALLDWAAGHPEADLSAGALAVRAAM